MKNLTYALIICSIVAGCEKYDSMNTDNDHIYRSQLDDSEITLRKNLDLTASLMADIIQDESVINEISQIFSEDRSEYQISFRDLLEDPKGEASFKNLKEKFLNICNAEESKGEWGGLPQYLVKKGCYIYVPYPACFYPKGIKSFTIAAHPIDNDIENRGFCVDGNKVKEVLVNEKYADKNPVILIMPEDEKGNDATEFLPGNSSGAKGDPVYEVRIAKIRCADYCGGIFEGTLELRIGRGYPDYNVTTGEIKGTFSTLIPVNYPRDYAKAAVNNWTSYRNGGWYYSNSIWDSNWRATKVQQCILAYEYDKVSEVSTGASVGFKPEDTNVTLTASAKTTYRGDFLGISEWDRDWFLATNSKPGPYDEVKDGLTVLKTCPVLKMTTPLRTIY